jgi:hypothetical protein
LWSWWWNCDGGGGIVVVYAVNGKQNGLSVRRRLRKHQHGCMHAVLICRVLLTLTTLYSHHLSLCSASMVVVVLVYHENQKPIFCNSAQRCWTDGSACFLSFSTSIPWCSTRFLTVYSHSCLALQDAGDRNEMVVEKGVCVCVRARAFAECAHA